MAHCREKTCIIEDLSGRSYAQPRPIAPSSRKMFTTLESAHRAARGGRNFGKRSEEGRGFAREACRRDIVAIGESFFRTLEQSLREDLALRFVGAEIFAIDSLFDLINVRD